MIKNISDTQQERLNKVYEFITNSPKWSKLYKNISKHDYKVLEIIWNHDNTLRVDYSNYMLVNEGIVHPRIRMLTANKTEFDQLYDKLHRGRRALDELRVREEEVRRQARNTLEDIAKERRKMLESFQYEMFLHITLDQLNDTAKTTVIGSYLNWKNSKQCSALEPEKQTMNYYFENHWLPSVVDEYKVDKEKWIEKYCSSKM